MSTPLDPFGDDIPDMSHGEVVLNWHAGPIEGTTEEGHKINGVLVALQVRLDEPPKWVAYWLTTEDARSLGEALIDGASEAQS